MHHVGDIKFGGMELRGVSRKEHGLFQWLAPLAITRFRDVE
jgi:hypothetical protein